MHAFRSFFLRLLRNPTRQSRRSFYTTTQMSSSGTAAALYAATVSPASILGAVPEDAKDKQHHLKDGRGFTNPWDSWRSFTAWSIIKAMAGYCFPQVLENRGSCAPGEEYQGLQMFQTQHPQQFQFASLLFCPREKPLPCVPHGSVMPVISSNFREASEFSLTLSSASGAALSLGLALKDIPRFRVR